MFWFGFLSVLTIFRLAQSTKSHLCIMHRTNLFISQNVSIDDVLLHRINFIWWKSVLNHSTGSTRKWVPERIFQRSYQFHLATCHANTCASLLSQKSFLSSLQRVFNTIRKVNVNCSLEIFRTFSCFAASTEHTRTGTEQKLVPSIWLLHNTI